jgi:hypothetical protein
MPIRENERNSALEQIEVVAFWTSRHLMDIKIQWHQPLPLQDGSAEDLIYMVDEKELQAWDGYAGVYMFCRQYGESVIPLYIGRSKNLYNRIWEHFETTTFMKRIAKSPRGEKVLIMGEYIAKPG